MSSASPPWPLSASPTRAIQTIWNARKYSVSRPTVRRGGAQRVAALVERDEVARAQPARDERGEGHATARRATIARAARRAGTQPPATARRLSNSTRENDENESELVAQAPRSARSSAVADSGDRDEVAERRLAAREQHPHLRAASGPRSSVRGEHAGRHRSPSICAPRTALLADPLPWPRDHDRDVERGGRQDTARREPPDRPPPPLRAGARAAGRQGHQRRPRAEGARAAGARDRARGRPHRHPHRRGADGGGHPQRLRADPGRVAHVDAARRSRARDVDRDRRVRPLDRGARARDGRRQARLPDARRRDRGVRGKPARATCPRTGTPTPCARRAARACRRCSTPRASRCASGWPASPTWSRRTSSRPRSSSGFEFQTPADFAAGMDRIVDMGARNVIITHGTGCAALIKEPGKTHRAVGRDRAARAGLRGRLRRRAAGRVPRRAPGEPAARRRASSTRSAAARRTRRRSARARSIRATRRASRAPSRCASSSPPSE